MLTNAQRLALATAIIEGVRADFLNRSDPHDLVRWIIAWQRRGGSLADAKALLEEIYQRLFAVGAVADRHAYRHWLEHILGGAAAEYEPQPVANRRFSWPWLERILGLAATEYE